MDRIEPSGAGVNRAAGGAAGGGGSYNEAVGPTAWKSGSLSAVDESNDAVRQARRTVELARSRDPLPGLRDVVAGLSNDVAHSHFRATRPVVHTLRDVTINNGVICWPRPIRYVIVT